jgi:hypothetical protein
MADVAMGVNRVPKTAGVPLTNGVRLKRSSPKFHLGPLPQIRPSA